MGLWGPLVKKSVCRCSCVQVCADVGAYRGEGMYVCAGAGVCRCVHVCTGCGCVQVSVGTGVYVCTGCRSIQVCVRTSVCV